MKLVAIIYNNYKSRQVSAPYFTTIFTLFFLLFLHLAHIALILKIPTKYTVPWSTSDSKPAQWLYAALFFCCVTFMLGFIFKKQKLEKIDVTEKQIKDSKIFLPIYFVSCILLLIFLLIKSGIEKGNIS